MARKHAGGHGGGEERWLLTYSDLITLLLAFFIIMYSSSKADLEKFGQLARSFQQTFGVLGLEGGSIGLLAHGAGLFEFQQLSASQRQFIAISDQLQAYAEQQGMGANIAVNMRGEGIAITLSSGLLFPSGGVRLGPESVSVLKEIAEMVRPLPNDIRIEAHTDNLPTNDAAYPTNWELSAARAAAVARYLIENEAIEPRRLSALGFGEFRPLYDNDTREHRALNRRADILILYPSERLAGPVNLLGQ